MLSRAEIEIEHLIEYSIYEFFGYIYTKDFIGEVFYSNGFYECGEQLQEDHRMFLSIIKKIKDYFRCHLFREPPYPNETIIDIKASKTILLIRWTNNCQL